MKVNAIRRKMAALLLPLCLAGCASNSYSNNSSNFVIIMGAIIVGAVTIYLLAVAD